MIDCIYKGLRKFSRGSINRGGRVTSIVLIKLYMRTFKLDQFEFSKSDRQVFIEFLSDFN